MNRGPRGPPHATRWGEATIAERSGCNGTCGVEKHAGPPGPKRLRGELRAVRGGAPVACSPSDTSPATSRSRWSRYAHGSVPARCATTRMPLLTRMP